MSQPEYNRSAHREIAVPYIAKEKIDLGLRCLIIELKRRHTLVSGNKLITARIIQRQPSHRAYSLCVRCCF